MPGNVQLATPSVVLPRSLFSAFEWDREWYANVNVYANKEVQGLPLAEASRRRWRQVRPFEPADAIAFREFYIARKGPLGAFYIYDFTDFPYFSHDDTGVSTNGRHTVRFDGAYTEELVLGRILCGVALMEIV